MKFSTSTTELQKALQKLSKATPTRTTLPILSCVYIKTDKRKTIFRSTDLELTIEIDVPSSLEKEGATSLPLKTLLEITSALPETRITLEVDDKNRAKIITEMGEYDLMAKPPEEFPQPIKQENEKIIKIEGRDLKNIISATSFAVSKDELKPALTGVLFKFTSEGLIAVATDGHRLVKHKKNNIKTEKFNGEVIIPRKFLSYMSSYLYDEETTLLVGETHLSAKIKKDTIITRIIGEKFPDYESVIPKENDKVFQSEKDAFLGAIRRVSIFSNKSTHQVAISLSPTSCVVTTEDPEKSSKARELVSATFEGEDLTIGYNAEYLKDIINHISGKNVVAYFSSPVSAALFSSATELKNTENVMLLMPIRLND